MATRLHTQDPTKRLTYLGVRQRAIREHLLRRLTEKQYRRVALLYGFDGEPMSQRETASAVGVTKKAVLKSKDQTLRKLKNDVYLWIIWLLCRFFRVPDVSTNARRGEQVAALHQEEVGDRPHAIMVDPSEVTEQEMGEMYDKGWVTHGLRPGDDAWATDKYTPRSRYDKELDRLTEEFETGSLTRVEYDRDMILAFAADKYEDADTLESDWIELRQEVEWALGAREMGALTRRDCDHRVSLALRSYVNGGD